MKISLFQGILFGVFGLAAIIGVFVFATYTSKNSSGSATTVGTVKIWGVLPKADVQAALTAVAQTDTSMKDVSYEQKNPETLAQDLSTAIATGAAPDLVLASEEGLLPLVKFLDPIPTTMLPESAFNSTFVTAGRIFAVPGGGYYGMPFLVDPLVLYSNNAILASSAVAKPPATWEALTGLVPNIAQLTPTKQVKRGLIAMGTYDNVHNARGILSSLFLQTGVPISSYRQNDVVANLSGDPSGGDTPTGQGVLSFYTQFADPSKVSYTWNASLPDSRQAFLAGDLALYLGFVSEARFLRAANPNLDFNVSQLPQLATSNLKSTYGLVYAFMVPRGAKNPNGGYQAAVVLTSAASQDAAAAATGLAPAVLSQLSSVPSDPVAAVAYAEALYAKGWLSPVPRDTDSVFSSMITGVISGRLLPSTALTSGEGSLTSLLQK
ncbi:MAG: extracellular solute-binding protein [Candidatus Paceibacterota bacterium]|jgi:ABC-type glycerol-3-phosphate transport system substrate-binding protein